MTDGGAERVGLLPESAIPPALPSQLSLCVCGVDTPRIQGTDREEKVEQAEKKKKG